MTSPTGDTSELADRLRAYAATFDGASTMYASHPAVLADEAAAAITTLERELEEARRIISACASALSNGAYIDAQRASLKFSGGAPRRNRQRLYRLPSRSREI